MTRWHQLTLGQVFDGLARYRPFALVLVGILLLALVLPGTRSPDEAQPGAGEFAADSNVRSEQPRRPDVLEVEQSTEATGVARPQLVGGPASADRAAATDAADGVREAAASAVQTVTEEDALSAPDCDPATGRIRIPWYVVAPPNCVPLWPGGADNGGATYRGVTRDTITIAIPIAETDAAIEASVRATGYEPPTEQERRENRDLVIQAFESYYETYGRKVKWVEFQASGGISDDAAARADAIKVANEIKAFASLGNPYTTFAYVEELEARTVLCLNCANRLPHWAFAKGYVWNFNTSGTGTRMFLAELLALTVGGKEPAKYAGDPLLREKQRKLGLIQYDTTDKVYSYSEEWINEQLGRFGMRLAIALYYILDPAQTQEQARTMITRLKTEGITTILVPVDPISLRFFTEEATRQQYFPEWILSGGGGTDYTLFARTYDQLQWRNAFGLTNLPVRMDPNATDATEWILPAWHHQRELSSYPDLFSLQLLYTGVHLAGPDLNAKSYGEGMFSFKPARGFISFMGQSFGRGVYPWDEYNAFDDMALIWWDPDTRGPDEIGAEGLGIYRFENMGQRYVPGDMPAPSEVSWFDRANSVTVYEQMPEQDRGKVLTYERPDKPPRQQ